MDRDMEIHHTRKFTIFCLPCWLATSGSSVLPVFWVGRVSSPVISSNYEEARV
jgi:hypothetical protein